MKKKIIKGLVPAAALLCAANAMADNFTTDADLLFNWAEAMYPSVFTSNLSSQSVTDGSTGYYYRGPYLLNNSTQFYVGAAKGTVPRVVILDANSGNGITDIGTLNDWLSTVGVATSASGTEVTTCTANYTQSSGTANFASQSYSANSTDASGVCAKNSSVLTLTNPSINTSGNTSSLDNSSFYGLNAAVLAIDGSNITISDGSIITTGKGANGAFATGVGSSISLKNITIEATGQGGHGVDATLGGYLALMNVTATTSGNNGSVIATDRGSGTIAVSGGKFIASGIDSAGVYSTGVITVAGAIINAKNGEAVVVEGGNSAVMTNCEMFAAKGTRDRGMFVYQSMSGDASEGTGSLTINGGSYTWPSSTGPAFYSTNTNATISLTGVEISNASSVLLKASADNWGKSGSNGGTVTLNATAQNMDGDIVADNISSVTVNLREGSSLNGAINNAGTAKLAILTLDSTSKWNLEGNSHLTGLTETGSATSAALNNISSNGYNVYYKASVSTNKWLAGATYDLNGGGKLIPE